MNSINRTLLLLTVGLLVSSATAATVDDTWTNTVAGGEWNSASSWNLLAPPNVGTNAWLTNSTALTVNYNTPMAAASFRTLTTSNTILNINAGGFALSNLSMLASSTVTVNAGGVVTLGLGATMRDLGNSRLVINGGLVSNTSASTAIVIGNSDFLVVSNSGTLYSAAGGVQLNGDNNKLMISGGSANLGAFLDVRDNGGNGPSAFNFGLSISNSTVTASSMIFATGAAANMSVAGGSTVTNTGAFLFSGADSSQNRSANYVQTGGSVVSVNSNIVLAANNNTHAIFTVSGGTLRAPGIVLMDSASRTNAFATFAVTNNGTVYLGANGITQNATGSGANYTNIFGGNAIIGAYTNWSSAVNTILTNGAPTIRAGDANGAAHDISLSGVLRGPGSLLKDGGGALTLGGANIYTGSTTVNAGTLLVNGSLPGGGGGLFVHAGATLGGTGQVNQAVTVSSGGTLSPGAPGAGGLTVKSLSLADNFVYNWELGATSTDRVDVTDASGITFSGTNWTLRLGTTGLPPAQFFGLPATNNVFVLMQVASGIVPAALTNNVLLLPGSSWVTGQYARVFIDPGHQDQLLLTGVWLVPEPFTLMLFGCGGLILWLRRRR